MPNIPPHPRKTMTAEPVRNRTTAAATPSASAVPLHHAGDGHEATQGATEAKANTSTSTSTGTTGTSTCQPNPPANK